MSELTEARREKPTIVEVWAPSCSECRAMKSDLESVAAEFADRVRLEKVDASRHTATAGALGVMATPTLIGLSRDGEVFRYTGRRSRAELNKLFSELATGAAAVGVGRHDAILRLGAGIGLIGIGLLAGPAWPLLAVGAVACGWGAASLRRLAT